MPNIINTSRLSLRPLSQDDIEFVKELVNTEGWLKFIGNRNISSIDEAKAYVDKILHSSNINYWVIWLLENEKPIGIVSLIKREYLEYHDIGFALLPDYTNQGFAHEATSHVLNEIQKNNEFKTICASTLPTNLSSIKLLERLKFKHSKTIFENNQELKIFINTK